MAVLRDMPIAMTAEEVLAAHKRRDQVSLLRAAEHAIALGQTLWQPAAVYGWLDVQAVEGEHVRAGGSATPVLHVGPKADLLAPARRLLVSVVTIGPALEERVRELETAGDHLLAYLLDNAGVLALGAASAAVRCVAEEAAAAEGWGVSASLSPGSLVGWPIQGQRELCALVPMADIGVQLNAHCVLVPHKSSSAAIGLGLGYDRKKVGSVCMYCALASTCWRRREETA